MSLKPVDIANKQFDKGFRGYDIQEVDDFLDNVVTDFEEVYRENSRLKDTMARLNDQIEHYKNIEQTIQNTLLLAQCAAEQSKENSQIESKEILQAANNKAKEIIDNANLESIRISNDHERVKNEYITVKARFRNFLNTMGNVFEQLDNDENKDVLKEESNSKS